MHKNNLIGQPILSAEQRLPKRYLNYLIRDLRVMILKQMNTPREAPPSSAEIKASTSTILPTITCAFTYVVTVTGVDPFVPPYCDGPEPSLYCGGFLRIGNGDDADGFIVKVD